MMPPYTSAEQEQEHDRQSEGQAGSVESHSLALPLPLPPTLPSRQLWDNELSNGSWSRRDFRQQFGAVCLIIFLLSF